MAHWLSRSDLPGPSDNPAELLHYARTGEGWPPGLPPPGRSLRDQHPPDSLVDPEVAALPAPIWRHLRRRCRVDRVHTGWWDVPETPGLRFDGELVAWGQASGGPRLAWTPEKKWLPNHSLTSLTESLPESPPWDEGPGLLLEHIAALLEELEAPAAEKAAFYNLFWLSAISPTMRVRKTVLPGNLLPLFTSTAFSVLPTRLQAALLAMNHILGMEDPDPALLTPFPDRRTLLLDLFGTLPPFSGIGAEIPAEILKDLGGQSDADLPGAWADWLHGQRDGWLTDEAVVSTTISPVVWSTAQGVVYQGRLLPTPAPATWIGWYRPPSRRGRPCSPRLLALVSGSLLQLAGPVSSTGRKMPQASLCIAQQVQAVHVDEEGLLWVAEDRLNSGELCPPGVQWIGRLAGAPVLRCNNVLLRWEGGGWRPLHPEPVSICAAHGRKVAFYDGKLCLRWPDGELEVLDPPDAAPTTLLLQRGMLWVGDGEGCIYRYAVGKPQQGRVEEVYPTRLGPVRTLVVKEGELHAGGEGGLLRVGRRPMLEARLRRRHHRAMHSLCHRSDVLGNSVAALIWLRWTDPLYA